MAWYLVVGVMNAAPMDYFVLTMMGTFVMEGGGDRWGGGHQVVAGINSDDDFQGGWKQIL
jgi:hypothetical protein